MSDRNDLPPPEDEPPYDDDPPRNDPAHDEPADEQFQEESPLNFERYDNQFAREYVEYVKANFAYLEEADQNFKDTFKEMINIEEVNVFFDLETEKNIDDVGFYLNFEEFNAREDPEKVRSLVKECSEILMSNQTNLEVDNKTVDQVKITADPNRGRFLQKNPERRDSPEKQFNRVRRALFLRK